MIKGKKEPAMKDSSVDLGGKTAIIAIGQRAGVSLAARRVPPPIFKYSKSKRLTWISV
jgi:hypothetical protein